METTCIPTARAHLWFLRVQKTQRQHVWQLVGSTTNVTRFPVDNPVVAFGNDAGGSPLYVGQTYNFGVFAGAYDERTGQTNRFRILVYDRSVFGIGRDECCANQYNYHRFAPAFHCQQQQCVVELCHEWKLRCDSNQRTDHGSSIP